MKTLYIDVYFLINFTVDMLAIYAAVKVSGVRVKIPRIMVGGAIGATLAIFNILFFSGTPIRIIMELFFILFLAYYICDKVSLKRRAKFSASFYICSFLISGAVIYSYGLLDRFFAPLLEKETSSENRAALRFSLLILMIIGVLRILIMVFTNSISEKSARMYIKIEDKTLELDALIDSGNLVKDPMNMCPVMFLKVGVARAIFPTEVIELCDIDKLDLKYKKRIRLIPVTRNGTTHVVTGIKVDEIAMYNKRGKREALQVTVAIDKEEGTFGGFEALIPFAAVRDVL